VLLRGLVLACHPGPSLAVTVLAVGLAGFAGASTGAALGLGLSVLLGQLSIGWSNDAVDAADDAAAGRSAKPVVRGLVDVPTLWRAALLALGVAVVASIALLGWVAGGLHVVAVLSAWAYNLRLKDTVLSPLPYAAAFGLVPLIVAAVAALGEPVGSVGGQAPGAITSGGIATGGVAPGSLGALAAVGALLGAGAHLANTAPDVESDRAVGRGGLAVRTGAPAARALAVVGCAVAAALLLVVVADASAGLGAALAAQVALLGVVAAWRAGRWLFPTMLVVAAADAVLLLALA
jgi:4-hydroxybenzoate polyprenyltransferase